MKLLESNRSVVGISIGETNGLHDGFGNYQIDDNQGRRE